MATLDCGRLALGAHGLGAVTEARALPAAYTNERVSLGQPIGRH